MAFTNEVTVVSTVVGGLFSPNGHASPTVVRLADGTLLAMYTEGTTYYLRFAYSDDNGATWNICTTTNSSQAWSGYGTMYVTNDGKIHVVKGNGSNLYYYSMWTFNGSDVTQVTTAPISMTYNGYNVNLRVFEDPNNSANYRMLIFYPSTTNTAIVREYTIPKTGGSLTYVGYLINATVTTGIPVRLGHKWTGSPFTPASTPPVFTATWHDTGYNTHHKNLTWDQPTNRYVEGTQYNIGTSNYYRGHASNLLYDPTNDKHIMAGNVNSSTSWRVYYWDDTAANATQLGATVTSPSTASSGALASDGSTLYLIFLTNNGKIQWSTYDLTGGLSGSWSALTDGGDVTTSLVADSSVFPPLYHLNENGSSQIDVFWTPTISSSSGMVVKLFGDWAAVSAGLGWGWIPIGG